MNLPWVFSDNPKNFPLSTKYADIIEYIQKRQGSCLFNLFKSHSDTQFSDNAIYVMSQVPKVLRENLYSYVVTLSGLILLKREYHGSLKAYYDINSLGEDMIFYHAMMDIFKSLLKFIRISLQGDIRSLAKNLSLIEDLFATDVPIRSITASSTILSANIDIYSSCHFVIRYNPFRNKWEIIHLNGIPSLGYINSFSSIFEADLFETSIVYDKTIQIKEGINTDTQKKLPVWTPERHFNYATFIKNRNSS